MKSTAKQLGSLAKSRRNHPPPGGSLVTGSAKGQDVRPTLPHRGDGEILAVVFDFDDTLVPDSTTKLLASYGVDTHQFWRVEATRRIQEGFDPTLAWLQMLLERVGPRKPLGRLSNQDLRSFGQTLDGDFYPGIPGLFTELRRIVAGFQDIDIEFYIISSGLREIICGSRVVGRYFKAVYGSEFAEDQSQGCVRSLKRCMTFTEKTRYLFEINKGLNQDQSKGNPYLVNRDIPDPKRRVPFPNMIYVGDGLTDIPCFSLVKKNGGTPFGVFFPSEERSTKRAFLDFLKTERVVSCHAPKYRKGDELGSLLRTAVLTRCHQIDLDRHAPAASL